MRKMKEYRLKFHYSHRQMAELLNISKTYYWQLENNKRRLSYDLAYKISNVFGVTPDTLFYEEYNKTKIN